MSRIADKLFKQLSTYVWGGRRVRVDTSTSSYIPPSSGSRVSGEIPDRIADSPDSQAGIGGLFTSSIKIQHVTGGGDPVFRLVLGGNVPEIRSMVKKMTRQEIAATSVSFDGTLAGFAKDKTDKVLERLRAAIPKVERASRNRGDSVMSNAAQMVGKEAVDNLHGIGPQTKLTFTLSGGMLRRLVDKGSLNYPALRALRNR